MQMLESFASRTKAWEFAILRRFEPNASRGSRVFVEKRGVLASTNEALRAENRRGGLAIRTACSGRPSAGGLLIARGSREPTTGSASSLLRKVAWHKTTRVLSAAPCHAGARGPSRVLAAGHSGRCALSAGQNVRPNPSLERTSTGLPLGPRGSSAYPPPRGPSTKPVAAAQLKR
jgi:hypothetical protein